MTISASSIRTAQPRVVFATFVVTTCALWVGAFNSGIAKQPMFVLGSVIVLALYFAECILTRQISATFSRAELVAAMHMPLFAVSAFLTYDVVYTNEALFLGISCVIFFFAGAKLFQTAREKSWLLDKITILTVVLCGIGVLQYLLDQQTPLDFYIGVDKRVGSLLGNSNFFSAYLVLAMPIVLNGAMRERTRKAKRWRYYFLAGVMAALLLATQARSSLIAFGIALLTFFLLSQRKESRKIAITAATVLAILVVLGALLNPTIGKRLTTMFDLEGSFGRRTSMWEGGLKAMRASPLVGHGIGKFEPTLFEFRSPDYWKTRSEDIVAHAHNEILEIGVEYGFIGIILSTALVVLVVRTGIRAGRTGKKADNMTAIALVSSIVGIAVDNLANVSLRQAPIALFVWLLLGVLSSMESGARRTLHFNLPLEIPRFSAAVPVILCLVFSVWYCRDRLRACESSAQLMKAVVLPQQRTADRIRLFDAAMRSDSTNLLAHSLLTHEHMKAKNWENVVLSTARLQSLSPRYPKSSLMLSYALTNLNRHAEALQAIREESILRNHPETYEIQSFAYKGLRDTTNERRALLTAIEKSTEGKIPLAIPYASGRLTQLNRDALEAQETRAALIAIREAFPTNIELMRLVQSLESGKK